MEPLRRTVGQIVVKDIELVDLDAKGPSRSGTDYYAIEKHLEPKFLLADFISLNQFSGYPSISKSFPNAPFSSVL